MPGNWTSFRLGWILFIIPIISCIIGGGGGGVGSGGEGTERSGGCEEDCDFFDGAAFVILAGTPQGLHLEAL